MGVIDAGVSRDAIDPDVHNPKLVELCRKVAESKKSKTVKMVGM